MPRQFQGAHETGIPVDAIMREYAAWSDEIVKAIGDAMLRATKDRALSAFKDKTGVLRARIRRKKSRFDKDTTIVGAFAPHAHLVEFGHDLKVEKGGAVVGHVPAHPFLSPAAESVRGNLTQIVGSVVPPTVEVKR